MVKYAPRKVYIRESGGYPLVIHQAPTPFYRLAEIHTLCTRELPPKVGSQETQPSFAFGQTKNHDFRWRMQGKRLTPPDQPENLNRDFQLVRRRI